MRCQKSPPRTSGREPTTRPASPATSADRFRPHPGSCPSCVRFYGSAVGKKSVMAVTGIMLLGFVLAHMIGNLKVYLGAAHLNEYGEWLRMIGEPALPRTVFLWLLRIGLIARVRLPHPRRPTR